ncbi:hypothetical protein SAMN05192564_106313 [Paraburkholderia sartisoli]|uniref:Uncharacterized protein n=1 Tax=Paraburkholderia sartisoli TaxID=83784 RepID=A0A1H4GUZ0_9BURK|nr:hypothetical protein SAMN05192564_106313 [Paraburkholderia sartisoli]
MQGETSDKAVPSPAVVMKSGFVGAIGALYTRII